MPAATPTTVQFGGHRAGCPVIEVEAFAPICDFDPVAGSAPLVLDVPVPAPAPIIPPAADCACFTFQQDAPVTTTVAPTCTDNDTAKLTLTVNVVQRDAECCTGAYRITPTVALELPCIPFDIGDGEATSCAVDRRGPADTGADVLPALGQDGGIVRFGLKRGPAADGEASGEDSGEDSGNERDCCTVTPFLEVEFPECLKFAKRLVDNQIAYNDRGTARNHTLVEWVRDEAHCSSYPVVHPLTLPDCALADVHKEAVAYSTAKVKNANTNEEIGTVQWKVYRENCNVGVHINDVSLNIPAPGGGGAGFGNGGDVGLAGGQLYIDGDNGSNADVYWGGGYGDWFRSGCYNTPNCRGPSMRGVAAKQGDPNEDWVPHASVDTVKFVISGSGCSGTPPCVTDGVAGGCEVKGVADNWSSGRVETSNGTTTHTPGSGNLNMIWPTGVQWHTDKLSVALPLTEFLYNPAGVLSMVKETKEAVLLAPGPAVLESAYTENGVTVPAGTNVSGLVSQPDDALQGVYRSGLRVNYGPGLAIVGTVSGGEPDMLWDHPSTQPGALTIYTHSDDIGFTPGNDTAGKYRLVLNDADTDDVIAVQQTTTQEVTAGKVSAYVRDSDFTVPVIMFHNQAPESTGTYSDSPWRAGTSGNGYLARYTESILPSVQILSNYSSYLDGVNSTGDPDIDSIVDFIHYGLAPYIEALEKSVKAAIYTINTLRGTYLHFGQAGMLMASNGTPDCAGVTRHSAGTPPSQSNS